MILDHLKLVIESLGNSSGQEFFEKIVKSLADAINCEYVFIGRVDFEENVSRTIALCANGEIVDNFEYNLNDTPCEDVAHSAVCHYPNNVTELFPNDQLLIDMKIESYIGTPLFDSKGDVLGLMVALSTSQIEDTQSIVSLFQLFSGRVSVEIERTEQEQRLNEIANIRLEETLKKQKYLQLLIEYSPGALAMFDREMKYLMVSNRWLKDYGREGKDVIGMSHYDDFPEIPDRWKDVHQRALSGETINSDQDKFLREDGVTQWVRWEVRPWYEDDNSIGGIIIFSEDITQLKKLEDERLEHLQLEKKQAEKANAEKSIFLSNMSHELRTPMHAILSFSNLGLKKVDDEKLERYFQNIRTSSIRLITLLNDLLDLSKLEVGKMKADFIEQDFILLIRQAENEVNSLLADKSISLNVNANDSFNCMVDQKLMIQAIVNLLSNAIKFSPEFSVIDVDVKKFEYPFNQDKKDIVRLSVIDEGVGIPEKEIESIFDKFVQSSKTMTNAGGTGLGLSITKEIMDLHRGNIYAKSPPAGRDKGTAIIFEIPMLQNEYNFSQLTTMEDPIEKHLIWKQFIDEMFDTKNIPQELSSLLISNENLCSLGMWLNSQKSDDKAFEELDKIHKDFHSLASECIEYIRMNDMKHANESKEEFDEVSNTIITMLKAINN